MVSVKYWRYVALKVCTPHVSAELNRAPYTMRQAKMKTTPPVLYSEMKSICDASTVSQKQGADIHSLSYLYFLEPVSSFKRDGFLHSFKWDFFLLLGPALPRDPIFGSGAAKKIVLVLYGINKGKIHSC